MNKFEFTIYGTIVITISKNKSKTIIVEKTNSEWFSQIYGVLNQYTAPANECNVIVTIYMYSLNHP